MEQTPFALTPEQKGMLASLLHEPASLRLSSRRPLPPPLRHCKIVQAMMVPPVLRPCPLPT